ncbi:MAG: DUF2240 family protein [Candidatus Methanoplasma sp.]|jgi:hypothetical protein|nr:DUF2240 family protein [Candidatus Methanoplasma sp.]
MPNEFEICLAALFLNKGKDVLTEKEFIMYASLDLRWMQVKDAEALIGALVERKLLSKTGNYLRPIMDISVVNVPIAYRPSEGLLNMLKKNTSKPPVAGKDDKPPGLLPGFIREAADSGMEKSAFVSECNRVSKKTDVDIEVAAMMILRERGVDIMPFMNDARSSVLRR